ncbi:complement component C8 gamma chain [Clupea harengus]|uniref:Complement component C8 gamma chain n=1 Tax=Clupea harengus TaxID=7950 RepID=A0A6P3W3S5_CLUHA|nr:complement component C8 gamma chain [Clupea harengus]
MRSTWICMVILTALGGLNTGGWVGASRSQGGRNRNRQKESPIDKITADPNLSLNLMAGKWFLISAASKCPYLLENGFKVESTFISVTPPTSTDGLLVSTHRKLNQQCWEIKQEYQTTKTTGRFLFSNKNPRKNIDIVIAETDHSSYVILYFQRQGKISMKLYGRSPKVPDSIADKFEELAAKQNLGLDYVFQFPDYSFCETTDKDYVLVI